MLPTSHSLTAIPDPQPATLEKNVPQINHPTSPSTPPRERSQPSHPSLDLSTCQALTQNGWATSQLGSVNEQSPPRTLKRKRPSRTNVPDIRQTFHSPTATSRKSLGGFVRQFAIRNEYEYEPLQSQNQIRILRLYAADKENEPLRCTLISSNLSKPYDGVPYDALSYYWGTDEPSHEIKIIKYDGKGLSGITQPKFFIRSNLFAALKAIRQPKDEVDIWVDAICINQENDVEKKIQVAMMETIYTRAQSVTIWLGEPTDLCPSDVAFPWIKKVCDLRRFDALLDEKYAEQWEALAKLMRNVWFSRRWVV